MDCGTTPRRLGLSVLVTALLLAAPGVARAETASSLPPVPPALDADTQPLLPAAKAIMAAPGTVWTKASALRTVVRNHVRGSCAVMANAYWALGIAVGLKVRRIQLSSNGVGGYDSHVTTEVWLPGPKIWALSDPTFDGWWSDNLSPQGLYPISARVVQYRVRHGQADALVWHQGGSLFLPPWVYYTDVRYVFRVLDYLLFVGGRTSPNYIVDNPTSVAWCCVAMTSTNLTLLPPDKTLPVTWVTVASPSQAEADFPTNPPPYGESRVATLHVTADPLGRGHWTIPGLNGRCGFEIVRGPAVGDWVVHAGADYPLAHLPASVSLSPVLCSTTRSVDVLHAAPGASFTIEVWLGKTFKAPA